jgi:hypothetical protein
MTSSVAKQGPSGGWIMKLALIAIGLLATTSQASPAFARGGGLHSEDPWNPQHIDGLPAEVRNDLARMCGGSRAQHQFAGYFDNSRVLVLHFEHFRCGDRGAPCTQAGCLHQVYVSRGAQSRYLGGRFYRELLRSRLDALPYVTLRLFDALRPGAEMLEVKQACGLQLAVKRSDIRWAASFWLGMLPMSAPILVARV